MTIDVNKIISKKAGVTCVAIRALTVITSPTAMYMVTGLTGLYTLLDFVGQMR
jgi:hypothetical protein